MQHPALSRGLRGVGFWRAIRVIAVVRTGRADTIAHRAGECQPWRHAVPSCGGRHELHARAVPGALHSVRIQQLHPVHQVVRHRHPKQVALN